MKNFLIVAIVLAVAGGGAYVWYQSTNSTDTMPGQEAPVPSEPIVDDTEQDTESTDDDRDESEDATDIERTERPREEIIGSSAAGHDIIVHNFGTGSETVLFIGGIHGGYAYNTTLLAYRLIDHLDNNPELIPDGLTVSIIPALNPDGIAQATGSTGRFQSSDVTTSETERTSSRFNANEVDLNRNFDCQWQSEGTWRNQTVSGGDAPFSEPETRAIQGFVQAHLPVAVVAWYAAAGEVFASACGDDPIMFETRELAELYAAQSGYTAQDAFTYYTITGDMMDWLARNEIPAISVLLNDRSSTEWNQNRTAIEALLAEIASQ